jgi:hypothetical protein
MIVQASPSDITFLIIVNSEPWLSRLKPTPPPSEHQGTETKLPTFLHFFYLPQVMQVKSENKKNYLWVQVAGKALVVSINE